MKELKDNNVENVLLNPVIIDQNKTNGSLRDNDILVANMNNNKIQYTEKNNINIDNNINDVLNKDYDLLIDIPKDFEERISKNYPDDFDFLSYNYYDIKNEEFCPCDRPLNLKESMKRKDIFKNILNRIVNVYHDKFLKKKNIEIGFDPLIEKTWYHSFDPDEECDDIPVFEIPLPPSKCSVFQDTFIF